MIKQNKSCEVYYYRYLNLNYAKGVATWQINVFNRRCDISEYSSE